MTNARDNAPPPPQIGTSEAAASILAQLTANPAELSTVSLDNCDVMVVGFGFDAGGEQRETTDPDGTKRAFTTQPQIQMQLQVLDIDGLDYTKQYFPIKIKADGTVADPQAGSQYGQWLSVMSGLGISADADMANRYKINSIDDLKGLKYHRQLQAFDGYRNRETRVHVATELYGFDNEFRASQGLQPAELAPEA